MKYRDNEGNLKEIRVKAQDNIPVGTVFEYDGDIVPEGYVEVKDITEGYATVSNNLMSNGWCRYFVKDGIVVASFCDILFTKVVDQSVLLFSGLPKAKYSGSTMLLIHSKTNQSSIRLGINDRGEVHCHWDNTIINMQGDEFQGQIVYLTDEGGNS